MARRIRQEIPPEDEYLVSDDTLNRHESGATFELTTLGNLVTISGADAFDDRLDQVIDAEDVYVLDTRSGVDKIEATVSGVRAVVVVEIDPRLLP